ncbi:ribose-phosphate pyrophosphokinase [Mesorhizobium sp.]|uniref:ribose-phosphate diphosphokinase n=1 Tax=Mesorhizobium sp. TaxID=1871066 RepID=UPI0025BB5345|nr:ribose-phosphate diphosphokinase [Mesorhizobium sp.]
MAFPSAGLQDCRLVPLSHSQARILDADQSIRARNWITGNMRFFALKGSEQLGAAAARALSIELDPHEERDFEDGEHKARPLVSVRGRDVYVLHSLGGSGGVSANDKLCKLLFFLATCKENGAARVTAVVPYLAYARKDRQTKARDPVTTRYVAQLFEAMGTNRIVTLDVHNFAAFQNAFRCVSVHLDTRKLFAPLIGKLAGDLPITIFSPDSGGVKRAQLLKEALEAETGKQIGFGFMEKRRSRNVVSGELFAGDVADSAVFIVDDLISTGGTMLRAALACRERGASAVQAIATHGLFGKGADVLFGSQAIDRIIVTDSVDSAAVAKARYTEARLEIVSVGRLIGKAIRRLRTQGSISELIGIEH